MSDRSDQLQLLSAAIHGDRDALAALWEECRPWLAAVVAAHKPATAEVEDILQGVAQTLVEKIDQVRDERALKPWLRTVAVNAARLAGRKRALRLAHEDELRARPAPEAHDDPAHAALGEQEHDSIARRVAALPEIYREPLLLRAVQGLSDRQIANILDLPASTVESRIARARRLLRETLAASAT